MEDSWLGTVIMTLLGACLVGWILYVTHQDRKNEHQSKK